MPVGLLGDVVEMSVKRHDVLVDIFDARMFVAAFSAPRLSPRGGATIALPLHGILCRALAIVYRARSRLVAGDNYIAVARLS